MLVRNAEIRGGTDRAGGQFDDGVDKDNARRQSILKIPISKPN